MSIEPGTTLPKQIVLRNDPSERTFAAVHKLQLERRRLFGIDPTNFRPRRTSDGPIRGLNLPPVTQELEPEIAKPLSVVSISSDDLDEDESPAALLPEVGFVSALVAGEDDLEIEPEETESGDDSIERGVEAGE